MKLKQQKEDNEKKYAAKVVEVKTLKTIIKKQKEAVAKLTTKKEEYCEAIKTLQGQKSELKESLSQSQHQIEQLIGYLEQVDYNRDTANEAQEQ